MVTGLVALIKKRLGIDPVLTPGKTGQFEVIADGEKIAERGGNWLTRKFGAGYPDLDAVVKELEKHGTSGGSLTCSLAQALCPSPLPRVL